MRGRWKTLLEVFILVLTAFAVVASGNKQDNDSDGGGGIQNIPREGWVCGTQGEICTCATSATETGHCPEWTEEWCCIMTPPDTTGGSIACDCISPTFLSALSMTCTAYMVQSAEATSEVVDICPLAPEDMP